MWVRCLLPVITVAYSRRLTGAENAAVQRSCGGHISGYRDEEMGFNQTSPRAEEYSWVVTLKSLRMGWTCSGVLISSRHVLTAAHCLFENYNEDAVLNKCGDRRLRWDQWFALLGSPCTDSASCKRRWYSISKIYYHEEYDPCTFENDLALFVLSSDAPEYTAAEICMPNSFQELKRNLTTAGHESAVVIRAVNQGDSGGPLFQTMSDGNVLVGIMSRGISCEYENAADLFTDVRFYTNWICEKSGVCTENL